MRDPKRIGVAASAKPAAVAAFDLRQLRGKDTRALPLLKAAHQLGLEGVFGKRADSVRWPDA